MRQRFYQQLLLAIERVPLKILSVRYKWDGTRLQQLEWLMFWSNEEFKLGASLIEIYQKDQEYDPELAELIATLSGRQQLFLERFVSLNANEDGISHGGRI